jgi:hypothetical protein
LGRTQSGYGFYGSKYYLIGENSMIYLYLNETQRVAEIVAELVKLNMGVVAELHGDKWHIEVTK